MSNPYSLHKIWSPETLQAYLDMPKNSQGYVISLLFMEGREQERMEPLWREWARRHPKNLHPLWFKTYAQQKNLRKASKNMNSEV